MAAAALDHVAASESSPFAALSEVRHGLAPHYVALRQIPNRHKLLRSLLYQTIAPELEPLLSAVETGQHRQPSPPSSPSGTLRVVAWNIQRGRHLSALSEALRSNPMLARADVLLLSEVDNGMGRSGNRNIARELATELAMNYAFGVSYLVLGDDVLENESGTANTLALAGAAVLSRWPLGTVYNLDLPELRDKFSSKSEKRLGKKRALAAEVLLPSGPLWVSTCHLDSNASPRQRSEQLSALLRELATHGERQLVGGDFNTTTYDASGKGALFYDLLHKFVSRGFNATVDGYMTPEASYEEPIFAVLDELGFAHDGFNDRSHGSYFYDVESPYAEAKLVQKVGGVATRWLQRRLRPWNGCVPAKLDWFVGRNLRPVSAGVVEVMPQNGIPVSDHQPILVDVDVK